jgi:hypothetical protein
LRRCMKVVLPDPAIPMHSIVLGAMTVVVCDCDVWIYGSWWLINKLCKFFMILIAQLISQR